MRYFVGHPKKFRPALGFRWGWGDNFEPVNRPARMRKVKIKIDGIFGYSIYIAFDYFIKIALYYSET